MRRTPFRLAISMPSRGTAPPGSSRNRRGASGSEGSLGHTALIVTPPGISSLRESPLAVIVTELSAIEMAISTTSCKTEAGSHFTLSVLLEGVNPTRDTYRAPLEDFMRAYFPATVKTLGCR